MFYTRFYLRPYSWFNSFFMHHHIHENSISLNKLRNASKQLRQIWIRQRRILSQSWRQVARKLLRIMATQRANQKRRILLKRTRVEELKRAPLREAGKITRRVLRLNASIVTRIDISKQIAPSIFKTWMVARLNVSKGILAIELNLNLVTSIQDWVINTGARVCQVQSAKYKKFWCNMRAITSRNHTQSHHNQLSNSTIKSHESNQYHTIKQ